MVISTAEIRKYAGINADFDFAVLQPHLEWAEENYVEDLLGKELYVKLKAFTEDNSEVVTERKSNFETLTERVNRMICHIGIFDWLSVAGVNLSDTGLQRIEGEMGGMTKKTAYQYQEKDAKEFYRRKGFNSMDATLQYLITNIDKFDEFKTSDSYAALAGDIIPDLKTFEKQYFIGKSYMLFMKLKPFIREAELFDIVPVTGKELYDEIKNKPDDEAVKALLPELRKAIAYKAIARGIEATSLNIVDDGARLIVKDSTNSNMEKTQLPELKNLIKSVNKTADEFIGMMCGTIQSDLSKYPKYKDNRIAPLDNTDNKFIAVY